MGIFCSCVYSPDLNPIEKIFNQIKLWCRRYFEDLSDGGTGMPDIDIIDQAFRSISLQSVDDTIAHNEFNPALGEHE